MIKLNEHCTILKRCTAKSQKVNSTFRAVASKALRQNGFDSEIQWRMVARRSINQAPSSIRSVYQSPMERRRQILPENPVEQIEIEVEDEPLLVNQADQVEISGEQFYN